ncbi:PEP-CTERM sorting domain-containing protein [Nitrosomonas oligotropha]|uniref:PEP-CTERM protein-sorting domain-containing protein n=1 Tax=Nitrosomonas oligotropha TaxID=42354 RepID=A0A1H8PXE5_9PROT|nr:PEP-CTERM sorting domain-containing protein [Nitrosomonas oligotropha]SDW66364.1 PEP-CTERM protein-sorting domain-containing protein [Nitrosomonas oligotropha]SEO46354.1 PEP-CTERM protein-sorting domain-containing protein [Nitrosomonas oligotropha]
MKFIKGTTQVAAALGLSVLLSGVSYASPAGSITVTNPGPLGSFSINTAAFDGTSGVIEKLTFDLSGTHCTDGGSCILGEPLVFGGSGGGTFAYDPEANGTSSLFGAVGSTVFGFDFTGFDPLNVFTFSWDPDVASNGGYGAIVAELAGTVVTASVRFSATEVLTYSGTMGIVGHDVAANLVPVPEPETYAMLLAGLGLIGFAGYRRKQAAAV